MRAALWDVSIRAVKTFLQTFIAVEVAAGSGYVRVDNIRSAAIAGGAAMLSFLSNSLARAER